MLLRVCPLVFSSSSFSFFFPPVFLLSLFFFSSSPCLTFSTQPSPFFSRCFFFFLSNLSKKIKKKKKKKKRTFVVSGGGGSSEPPEPPLRTGLRCHAKSDQYSNNRAKIHHVCSSWAFWRAYLALVFSPPSREPEHLVAGIGLGFPFRSGQRAPAVSN